MAETNPNSRLEAFCDAVFATVITKINSPGSTVGRYR